MIETYCPAVHDEMVKIGVNSKGGRGGMTAKMQAAWMAAQQGVTTIIANGKASDSLLQVSSTLHSLPSFAKCRAPDSLLQVRSLEQSPPSLPTATANGNST